MHGVRMAMALAGVFLIGGCGPSISKVTPQSPVHGASVQIVEFDMSKTEVTSFTGPTSDYGLRVAQRIARALNEAGVSAEAVPQGSPRRADVVVEGQVARIDGGSRALRYWIGFGAGATRFAVEGSSKRASGEVLGEFADERRSGFGMFGGDAGALLDRCVESVAYDVAAMVTSGKYARSY